MWPSGVRSLGAHNFSGSDPPNFKLLNLYLMTTLEKLEFFAENTNNINELRDLIVEVLYKNKVDYNATYLEHKKMIDKCLKKYSAL